MKFNKHITLAGLMAIALITGAGTCNKGGNAGTPPTTTQPGCVPGQFCPGGGWGGGTAPGGAILSGPVVAAIDVYGSGQAYLSLNIGASGNAAPGTGYTGAVNISGNIQMNAGCQAWGYGVTIPAGNYGIQGTGQWEANYGGTAGRLRAQLQMGNGVMLTIEPTLVYYGSYSGIPNGHYGFYMKPFGSISSCGGFGPTSAY